MELWELSPNEGRTEGKDPWTPWYDKAFGFVVRAENETQARQFAHEVAGDENSDGTNPWLSAAYSTCKPLSDAGEPGVVMRDFASA